MYTIDFNIFYEHNTGDHVKLNHQLKEQLNGEIQNDSRIRDLVSNLPTFSFKTHNLINNLISLHIFFV